MRTNDQNHYNIYIWELDCFGAFKLTEHSNTEVHAYTYTPVIHFHSLHAVEVQHSKDDGYQEDDDAAHTHADVENSCGCGGSIWTARWDQKRGESLQEQSEDCLIVEPHLLKRPNNKIANTHGLFSVWLCLGMAEFWGAVAAQFL